MKTLQEALTLVPEYFPLVPGVDKWRTGDEMVFTSIMGRYGQTFTTARGNIGDEIPEQYDGFDPGIIARRPVPQSVREAEARWILYNNLATVSTRDNGWLFGLRPTFDSEDQTVVAEHVYFCTETNTGFKKIPEAEHFYECGAEEIPIHADVVQPRQIPERLP